MRGKNDLQSFKEHFRFPFNLSYPTYLLAQHIHIFRSKNLNLDFLQDKFKVGNYDYFHDDQNYSWAYSRSDQGYPSDCADISLPGRHCRIEKAKRAIHQRGESISFTLRFRCIISTEYLKITSENQFYLLFSRSFSFPLDQLSSPGF